jgi:LysM repeat protein
MALECLPRCVCSLMGDLMRYIAEDACDRFMRWVLCGCCIDEDTTKRTTDSAGQPSGVSAYTSGHQHYAELKRDDPPRETAATCAHVSQHIARSHVVVAGDTVSSVAMRHGIRRDELVRWNKLISGDLVPGRALRLQPPDAVEVQTPAVVSCATTPAAAHSISGHAGGGSSLPSEEDRIDMLRAACPRMSAAQLRALLRSAEGDVSRAKEMALNGASALM